MKGEIVLYDRHGNTLKRLIYGHRAARTKEINGWKYLYGNRLELCFYHIHPFPDPKKIPHNGINRRAKTKQKPHF